MVSSKVGRRWREFKNAFEYLYLNTPGTDGEAIESEIPSWAVNKTARALDILGHCDLEFSQSGRRVHAAPPVLARLPIAGLPQAVLTGSRSPKTIPSVKEACKRANEFIEMM